MTTPTPKDLVVQLLGILDKDRAHRLDRIDRYIKGEHDDPYMPDSADAEYQLLAKRSVANVIPLLIGTVAQAMYVDGFRRGHAANVPESGGKKLISELAPEWEHWQFSHMDSRQTAIHRSALGYGHSFTITLRERKRNGKAVTRGLSPLNTTAVFEDPANDIVPYAALTVDSWPRGDKIGEGRLWDEKFERSFTWKYGEEPKVGKAVRHGASQCPVTRFAACVDLEGRTIGVAEPMIPLNDRVNQTIFDLLVAQTGASFKTRWATGMAPPLERDAETGEVVLDERGQPKPLPINLNAKKFLFGEAPDIKFGTLDETPLDGYIGSIEAAFRHMAAISQTPPHHILGQIANLSADALHAAEISLARKIEEFRKVFGEAWERVFQIAAELDGHDDSANDWNGEVIWRDMDGRSLAQNADALGKLREMLGIPGRGLWHRVPGATQGELELWEELAEREEPEVLLAEALSRSTGGDGSSSRRGQRPAVPAE